MAAAGWLHQGRAAECPALAWHALPAPAAETILRPRAHPHLLMDEAAIRRIRAEIARDPQMRETWTRQFLPGAARILADDPARRFRYRPKRNCTDDQEWMRELGGRLAYLAFGYVITGDRAYLDGSPSGRFGLIQYLEPVLGTDAVWTPESGYPSWGTNEDLAAGALLQGLGLTYDWVGDRLPAPLAANIRRALAYHGAIMFDAAMGRYVPDRMGNVPGWHDGDFLQGHLFVNIAGLLTAAEALADSPTQAAQVGDWAGIAVRDLRISLADLGPDGASQEGASYAGYALEALLTAMDLAEDAHGVPARASAWFAQAPAYYLYLSLPLHAWKPASAPDFVPSDTAMSLGDNPSFFSRGPDYLMRRLARDDPDGPYGAVARGFARLALEKAANGNDDLTWLNFLWHDRGGPEAPLSSLPTTYLFPDYGIVSSRSDWSGNESLLVFIAGAPMGHANIGNREVLRSASHVHPYQNSFYIFGAGQYIVRNVGYEMPKFTQNENTLRVDGKPAAGVTEDGMPSANGIGQLGEGGTWFDGAAAVPRIDATMHIAHNDDNIDEFVGEAASAYPDAAGLALYRRTVLFLKHLDAVIVLDDVRFKPGSASHTAMLDVHPVAAMAQAAGSKGMAWDSVPSPDGKAPHIRFACFGQQARVAFYANPYRPQGGGSSPLPLLPTLTMTATAPGDWRNGFALSWSRANDVPVTVRGEALGTGRWQFHVSRHAQELGALMVDGASVRWQPR